MMPQAAVRPPTPTLHSERGAFDLPSIITGVVVVGVLTAGVLASIFGVIPFAQDHGAKQDNAAVRTAEGVAKAKDGRFLDSAGLVAAGYLPAATISAAGPVDDGSGFARVASSGKLSYAVATDALGQCFVSVAKSGSGTVYFATDAVSEAKELTPAIAPGCLDAHSLVSLVNSVGGYPVKFIPAAPAGATGAVTTSTTATFSWGSAGSATGYMVEVRVNGGSWVVLSADQAGTSAVVTGAKGDILDVRVSSINAAGTSAPSPAATVTLPAGPNFASPVVWTQRASAPAGTWTDVASSSDGTKLVAVQSGGIYRSADSGASWAKLPAPALSWSKIATSEEGTKLIAISGREIHISSDSGATWAKKYTAASSGFTAVGSSGDGTRLIAALYNSSVYTSTDSGTTWTAKPAAGSLMWDAAKVSANGTTMTATSGYNGTLRISRDGGVTWGTAFSYGASGISGLALSADGKTMLGATGGRIRISTDGGVSFGATPAGLPADVSFHNFAISSDGTKMVASGAGGAGIGGVYTSTDGGVTWTYQSTLGTVKAAISTSADGGKIVAATTSMFTGIYGD